MPDSHLSDKNLIEQPLWNLKTFNGRLGYFVCLTDFRNAFVSTNSLLAAKELVESCRKNLQIPSDISREQYKQARILVEGSFHPDSGELQNVFGRMNFQVPGGMVLTGAMLACYRTVPQVVISQWLNQSFNSLVNYTNRNAASPISSTQLGIAYVSATSSAVLAAVGLKSLLAKFSSAVLQRLVPLGAVAAAHFVNVPLMRQGEIKSGIVCFDEEGNQICQSKFAAVKAISQVIASRLALIMPAMIIPPFIMPHIEKQGFYIRYGRYLNIPIQTALAGSILLFSVPFALSIFPQTCSIATNQLKYLDQKEYERVKSQHDKLPERLYFNKGL